MTARGARVLIAVAALLPAGLAGQEPSQPRGSAVVSGRVVGADTRAPLPSAIVELVRARDSLRVGGTLTDAQGRFRVERVPAGVFLVRLTSLGYGTVSTETFEVAEGEARQLGALALVVEAVALAPITVSAERTAVVYEADRTSYNVGVMVGTAGASVSQMLATIPELQVDIDGRVTLRDGAVSIYINGREAPMTGDALAVFLEQLPADLLTRVEVIDNPSARYDARGSGGVINLVTREDVELGMSGSVFANAGTRGQYGVGGRATLQRGAWTVNGGGFLRLSDSETTGYDLRQNLYVDPAFLRQDSRSERSGLSTNLDLELEYEPAEGTRLFVQGRATGSGDDSGGLTTTTHLDDLSAPILTYGRARTSEGRDLSLDLSTGFSREWEAAEQELQIEVGLQRGSQRQDGREEITERTDLGPGDLIPAELTVEEERELETELSVEASYARTLGEDTELEVGYEAERTESDNDRLVREVEDPIATPDGETTNRGHDQRELTHSVFATLQRGFGALSVEGGLRSEWLDVRFALPTGLRFGRAYQDLYPSANVAYRLGDDWRFRLSYSRRVEHPSMTVLNPVDRSTDPNRRRVGNPDIEPQFTHSLSMEATWSVVGGSLRLSPYYRVSRNGWTEMTTVDDRGVATETYQNVASRESYGGSLTYSLRERDGWGGNVGLSAQREIRDASNLDARYSGATTRFSTRASVTGRVTGTLSGEGNFSYDPPTDLPQGRREARYRADLGLRYRLLGDRASVRVSLRDPFGLERSSSRLQDLDYVLIGRSQESTRSMQVNVTYALGGRARRGGGGGRR
jgi:outer membrane cobalamin receptor